VVPIILLAFAVSSCASEQYPAASNESAKGRRNNRRVEVTVR
jgi:outer membrane protein OmpA-like peptidoglycan-associated protein